MEYFLKLALLFSFLIFAFVFTFRVLLSKDINGIEILREESSVPSMDFPKIEIEEEISKEALSPLRKELQAYLNLYETYPGEVLLLKVKADDAKVSTSLLEGVDLYKNAEGELVGFVPIRYDTAPGKYDITVISNDGEKTLSIDVLYKEFPEADIVVPEETAQRTVQNKEANDEYNEKLQSLKWINEDEPLWEGCFIKPLKSDRITSSFGEIRKVNGRETGRHGGIDYAAPKGTEIIAPEKGKVLFADFLTLTGNTLMIEHGMGLKTIYYHMDEILVSAGDTVEKGDLIGKVGSTGFATGPHLHFAAAIENIYINPETLFNEDIKSFIE